MGKSTWCVNLSIHKVVQQDNNRNKQLHYLLKQRVEEYNGLDGLAQAHLICQDGVCALSPRKPQPVQTLQLVQMQRAARRRDKVRLLLVFYGRLEKQKETTKIRN